MIIFKNYAKNVAKKLQAVHGIYTQEFSISYATFHFFAKPLHFPHSFRHCLP